MLSFFRTEKECSLLKKLFPENTEFKIIITLRKQRDFIESYKKQILKYPTRSFSKNKNSALYVEDDSWVFNHEKLIEAYSIVFDEIKIFKYGNLVNDEILDYLNIHIDSNNIRKNKSANLLIIKAKRMIRKLIDNKFLKKKYIFVGLSCSGSTSVSKELIEMYGGKKVFHKHCNLDFAIKELNLNPKDFFIFFVARCPIENHSETI